MYSDCQFAPQPSVGRKLENLILDDKPAVQTNGSSSTRNGSGPTTPAKLGLCMCTIRIILIAACRIRIIFKIWH